MKSEKLTVQVGDPAGTAIALTGYRRHFGDHGPRVLVTGGIHGDEITSIGACWYLAERLNQITFDGILTIVPCVNDPAVRASRRLVPLEETDLNRVFPGRRDGSLAERFAAALVGLLDEHDFLLDVHTAGWCIPFALIDDCADLAMSNQLRRWAACSGLPIVGEMRQEEAKLQQLERSWSAFALSCGKPALTIELTGNHTLDSACAQRGADVLVQLLEAAKEFKTASGDLPRSLQRLEVYANCDGLLEILRKPGDAILAGAVLGVIRSLEGNVLETVRAPRGGLLIAAQPISAMYVGAFVATIAIEA